MGIRTKLSSMGKKLKSPKGVMLTGSWKKSLGFAGTPLTWTLSINGKTYPSGTTDGGYKLSVSTLVTAWNRENINWTSPNISFDNLGLIADTTETGTFRLSSHNLKLVGIKILLQAKGGTTYKLINSTLDFYY